MGLIWTAVTFGWIIRSLKKHISLLQDCTWEKEEAVQEEDLHLVDATRGRHHAEATDHHPDPDTTMIVMTIGTAPLEAMARTMTDEMTIGDMTTDDMKTIDTHHLGVSVILTTTAMTTVMMIGVDMQTIEAMSDRRSADMMMVGAMSVVDTKTTMLDNAMYKKAAVSTVTNHRIIVAAK